ncbi:glutathione peroxidase [Jatrophihabitans sp.]|uniref:glutathione peroxidase n=1 Tax=Jatrophihabitans sp. TaxID=1932789 RepID=UPI0030C71A56|nr:Peroxiredoxin [Jatrophihabitans sp.]
MSVHDYSVATAEGETKSLGDYAGQTLLIVNVASKCGLTPQYTGLEAMQQSLGAKGLQVLGFPSNQFGAQEPGSNEEIQQFCSTTYGVSFPVFAKVDVNGDEADPLYGYLRTEAPGDGETDDIPWNFTKFLVGPDGTVIKRFGPRETPEEITDEVAAAL